MSTPFIIGHRGACGHAPENTMGSIRKAAQLGANWVEFDTMLSADNRVILFHDDSLQRITGVDGLVAKTNIEKLQKLDAGSWFSDQYADEKIPLLEEVMDLLGELGMGAVVEIKPSLGRDEETARLVSQMLSTLWPKSLPGPLVSSFNEQALSVAMTCAPHIPRALNERNSLQDWQSRLREFECVALHCREELVDETIAAAIINAGYDLRCFTVNDVTRAQTLSGWGVKAIFTDFPDRF